MGEERDFYTILGVSRDASGAEIRRAFREMAKALHPDSKQSAESVKATYDFSLLTAAYETLRDGERRKAYDDELNRARQLAANGDKRGRSPGAFATGLAIGLLVAVLAIGAKFYLDTLTPEPGLKSQDSLRPQNAQRRVAAKPVAVVPPEGVEGRQAPFGSEAKGDEMAATPKDTPPQRDPSDAQRAPAPAVTAQEAGTPHPASEHSKFIEDVLALERAIDLGGAGTSAHRLISLVRSATDIDELNLTAALVYKPETRELIQSRIDALKKSRGDAHPAEPPSKHASVAPPPQDGAAPKSHGSESTGLEIAIGPKGSETVRHFTPGNGQSESFSDCPQCPEMVVIPSGQAVMGSQPEQEGARPEETPAHRITLRKVFSVSKYPISIANWRPCVDAGACRPMQTPMLAIGQHVPVTRVSWFDAKAYVEWLSQLTGRSYRLLSEAEWEYSARAGARRGAAEVTARSDRLALESIRNAGSLALPPRLRPPGILAPNGWGLHAMGGTLFEWVEDCWHGRYERAPLDGSAWLSAVGGDCAYRVVRGGSAMTGLGGRRHTARAREFADTRAPTLGFRVARDLPLTTKTALDAH